MYGSMFLTYCTIYTQTNGLTERFNQKLLRNLCKLTDDDKNNWDWDLKLETVLMGDRCSRQETIKRSPYYMLFQKEMHLIKSYHLKTYIFFKL